MPNTDIEILVGVQGGASIKNGSGKLIRNQIEGIIRQTQRQLKLELSVNEKLIQDQITNAIKKMPAVKIAVTPDFGDGVSKNGKGSSGNNGGKATGTAASYQAEINKIGRIVADANKTNLKVFDVQETSKQRKEIERQVNSALVSVENAEKKLSETSKKPIDSIQKAVQMVPAVVKSENDRAMKVAAVNDEYDKQIAKLKEVRQAAESANTSLSSNASDRTKGSNTYKAYSEQFNLLNAEAGRLLGQAFNESAARSQITDVETLISLYKELGSVISAVQAVEDGVRRGDAQQLQNIANLQEQKYKLLTARAGYDKDSEMYKYLSSVIDKVSESIRGTKKDYHDLTGESKDSINAQVNGFKNVENAADAFRRKLAGNEDAYNANIRKLKELQKAADESFSSASNQYGGESAASLGVSSEWNAYLDLRERVSKEAADLLNGSFDKNNSQGQINQIQRVITSYHDLDVALKRVNTTQKQNVTAVAKADNASLAMQKVAARTYEFYQKIKDTASPEFQSRVLALFDSTRLNNYAGDAKKATAELVRLENEAYACGYAQESLGQKISRVFKQKFGYLIMAVAAMKLRQGLQQVYKNVVDIDTAMTELKKVTDETASTYNKFLDGAADRAKMLGATLSDTVTATADFARLGYSLDEASNLADSAIVYKNVGDGIDSINDASESVISTMKAFNVEATKSMNIVDKFNEVGNNFAISSKGVGDALLNSASALAAANNDLDQSIALVTAANSVVQDPTKVGTSLKTVSMYLRAAKSEAEDAGESTDGMAESVSKLQEELLALTGNKVNIMLDNQNFKSTYQILKELSAVWKDLSDVTQANILEKIGGKRNSNVVSAILNNFTIAEEALTTAQNSAGSALAENEKYLDSINGKISQMQASFQNASANILDNGIVKGFYTVVTKLLDAFNWLDEKTNGLSSGFLTLSAAILVVVTAFQVLKASAISGAISSIGTMTTKLWGLVRGFFAVSGGAGAAGAAIGTLNTAMLGWVGVAAVVGAALIGIGVSAYKAYQEAHPSLEDLREDLDDLKSTANDLKSEIDSNISRIMELQELANRGSITLTEQAELDRLRQENALLEQKYRIQQNLIDQQQERVENAARDKATEFLGSGQTMFDGSSWSTYVQSGSEQVTSNLQQYKEYTDAIKAEYEAAEREKRDVDQAVISKYENLIQQRKESLQNQIDTISALILDLDPEKDADIIKQLQGVVDQIEVTIGGPTASGNIIKQTLNSRYYENATLKLKELANAGKLTKESLTALYNNDAGVAELVDYLQELGLFSFDNIGSLATQLKDVGDTSLDVSQTLGALSDQLKAMTDKYDLLYDAQEEFKKAGAISSDTLSAIAEKYPELASNIGLYIAGMRTGKELLADLSNAYQNDVTEYKKALASKLSASPEFYNSLSENQKTYINDLAESYKVDLKNFKDLETAKLQFQAGIIQKLAANYSQYTGASVDMLYDNQQRLILQIGREKNAWKKAELQGELTQVTQSIQAILKFQNELDAIALNGVKYDPSKYSPSKIKDDGKTGTDKYKQEVEKQIKILQHKREMDLITDRQYYEGLREIENTYYKDSEKHKQAYAEEIWDLDQEIFNGMRDIRTDWFSDQEKMAENFSIMGDINSQRMLYEDILKEAEKAIDEAHEYGLDENSDYVQELRDQYHKTCQANVSMVQDAYDDFKSYADDFNMWGKLDFTQVEFLEKNLREIKKLYEEGKLGWTEYVEAYNKVAKDLYDTKKDSIETIIDMTMQMIEQEANDEIDALEDQIDDLEKIIGLKKKLLQDTNDEADHEKQVADAVAEIAKLQSKISQLSLDDSRSAYAQRVDLESQLADKQKELADLQSEYTLDKTLDTLDETKQAKEDAAEDEKEAIEKSIDSWVKKYNLAIKKIDGDWDGLYKDLNNWMAEHRDSIDGPDSLKTAWENVDQMVRQTGKDMESIYNDVSNIGINPDATTSSSAQAILDKMQANSAYALLNPGSGLSATNAKLADDYYKATGRKLYYNDSVGWVFDSKTSTNAAYKILGSKAKSNPYTAGTAQYGEKNSEAVKWIQTQLKAIGYKDQSIDGNYWQTTAKNVAAFAAKHHIASDGKRVTPQILKYLKAYHTGGIVDNSGAINDKEVLAILKKGELVLNDGQKANLRSVMQSLSAAVTVVNRTKFPFSKNAYGATQNMTTFAPQLSVTISHNGKMTDADADRYGNRIGNIALETMYKTMRTRGIKG